MSKKISISKHITLSDIKQLFNDHKNLDRVNFAHYPFNIDNEDEFCDIIRKYSKSWKHVSFHACISITDKFFISVLFSLQCNLYSLDLSSCRLSDKSVWAISHSLHSKTLNILKLGSSSITNDCIIELCKQCPNINHLHLGGCLKISDKGIINSLIEKSKNNGLPFSVLMLSACKNITNESINYLANSQGEYLTKLSFSFCYQITDSAIYNLAINSPNIQSLNLCGCKLLGDKSAISLLTNCKNLISLSMNSCKRISFKTIEYIELNQHLISKELYYFDLRGCTLLENIPEEQLKLKVSSIISKSKTNMHLKYKFIDYNKQK